jgi:hypothetical protein
MSHCIPVLTQDEESIMALPISASNIIPVVSAPLMKASAVQLNLFGRPSVPVTRSVTVPSYRKKNGTLVASHTRQVQVSKFNSAKKDASNKKRNKHVLKFHAPNDCKESVSLAHYLRIQEL